MSAFRCFNFALDVLRSFVDIHVDLLTVANASVLHDKAPWWSGKTANVRNGSVCTRLVIKIHALNWSRDMQWKE